MYWLLLINLNLDLVLMHMILLYTQSQLAFECGRDKR